MFGGPEGMREGGEVATVRSYLGLAVEKRPWLAQGESFLSFCAQMNLENSLLAWYGNDAFSQSVQVVTDQEPRPRKAH